MLPNRFFILFFFILMAVNIPAKTTLPHNYKYYVFFTNKNTFFNPYIYFSEKAIERRIKSGISLFDSSDFPVNDGYLKAIRNNSDSITVISRWFNMVTVYMNDFSASKIQSFPFVSTIEKVIPLPEKICYLNNDTSTFESEILSKKNLRLLKGQTGRMKAGLFAENNINGKDRIIAILDAGFPSVDTHPCFAHIRKENRILDTYDFIKKNKYVYSYSLHGTMVLSCIAGMYHDIPMGMATGAKFLLARTEKAISENFSEEENWLAAAEWADRLGADIISSSLGYTFQRYFYKDMNGKVALVTKAATMAARKGILVINAAGNEGDSDWHFIASPGDADSILTIGGTDPYTDIKIDFSSFGPTYDLRLKPNVCAYGIAIVATRNSYTLAPGTSFSTPLVCGFSACAWSLHPEWTNMQVYEQIQKSGNLYPYFDYAHGYGVPQANFFIDKDKNGCRDTMHRVSTFVFDVQEREININLNKEVFVEKENKLNLYFKIRKPDGFILKYRVMTIEPAFYKNFFNSTTENTKDEFIPITIFDENKFEIGNILEVHFEGYTESYTF